MFNKVDASYQHRDKHVTPQPNLEIPGAELKWYDLHPEERPITADIETMAREHLLKEARDGKSELDGELGFVILHLCGKDFFFLIVSTWRGSNELWETVYYKDGEKMAGFEVWPRKSRHIPTYCVWEMVPVEHERRAWVKYLKSARDDQARRAYVSDRFTGPA